MTSTKWMNHVDHNEMVVSDYAFPELNKALTNVELNHNVLVNFDHIVGESESDRHQIFSNLLKAACYFGLGIKKIDFHRQE